MFGLHGRRDGLLRVAGKYFPITTFRQLCPYETDTLFFIVSGRQLGSVLHHAGVRFPDLGHLRLS